MPKTLKLRLAVDVTYDLNGEDPNVLESYLEKMVARAIGDGLLTGASAAEVDTHDVRINEVPETPDEAAIEEALAIRLENGTFLLEDVPSRLARYGLMDPVAFVVEMRERMEMPE